MNEITRVTLKGGAVIDTAMTPEEVLSTYREALNREAPEDKPDEQPDQTMTLVTEEKHGEYTVRTETSFDSNLIVGLGKVEQPVESVEAPKPAPKPKAQANQNGKRVMSEETKARMREARKEYWAEVKAGKRPAPKRKAAAAA